MFHYSILRRNKIDFYRLYEVKIYVIRILTLEEWEHG